MPRSRLTMLAAGALLASTPLSAQGGTSGQTPSMELLLRLLGAENTTILVGEAPAEISDVLYLPPGAEIIGSVVRSYATMVEVDLVLSPEATIAQLEQRYSAADWITAYRAEAEGGFLPHPQHDAVSYCRDRYWVSLNAREGGSRTTRLRVSVREQEARGCGDHLETYVDGSDIPVLLAPRDTEVAGMGGGGSIDHREVKARLRSDLSSDALAAHYAQQIEAVGWRAEAVCSDGPLAVGLWSMRTDDDTLSALLIIRERDDQSDAVFRVSSAKAEGHFR